VSSPEPGWYEHPDDTLLIRWWDGSRWSDHIRASPHREGMAIEAPLSSPAPEAAASAPKAPSAPPSDLRFIVGVFAAAALVIGMTLGAKSLIGVPDRRVETNVASVTTIRERPVTTDPQQLEAAFAAEVARSCAVIDAEPGLQTAAVAQWDELFTLIGRTEADLRRAIDQCAQPAREEALARITAAIEQAKLDAGTG